MRRVDFILPLRHGVRIRHSHVTAQGRVTRFVLQLEARVRGAWRPIVRYDTAHGHPHRHLFRSRGRQRREPLPLTLGEALTFAQGDLDRHWEDYVERFGGETRA